MHGRIAALISALAVAAGLAAASAAALDQAHPGAAAAAAQPAAHTTVRARAQTNGLRDIVVPAQGRQIGSVLLIHGGGWWKGGPSAMLTMAQLFAAHGFRAVSLDYPLFDVPASYATAMQRAAELRAQGQPVIAVGESAGGAIATWLAARDAVDAAVAVAPPADLRVWKIIQPGQRRDFLPKLIGIARDPWRWSPARIYRSASSAPLLVFQSPTDNVVEPRQALILQKLGARLRWITGHHTEDPAWHQPALDFALSQAAAATRP